MKQILRATLVLWAWLVASSGLSAQVRVKDVTEIIGLRSNQLTGYGLVVGLDGTGGRSTITQKTATDMLQRMGVTAQIFSQQPSDPVLRSTNISIVAVVANIGPFSKKGSKIDVTVASIDDARSLQGGTLLRTPLFGADGQVYAVAQGDLSIGGFSVSGTAAGIQKNQVNVGRIPNGATVEKEALGHFVKNGKIEMVLNDPDFNTSRRIASAINEIYPRSAFAVDAGSVILCLPPNRERLPAQFVAEIGLLEIDPDTTAKVIINERTGSVVVGSNVKISPVAITHGNLFITVIENPVASQPNPFGQGSTVVLPRTSVGAQEEQRRTIVLPKTTTVYELANAMNALGVTPRDIIEIFQNLKKAGALHAELKIGQ